MKKMAHIIAGKVTNVSLWDGVTTWYPGEEIVEIPEDTQAGIGWSYSDGSFVDNRPKQPYPSWIYDEATDSYLPPVPQDNPKHVWSEKDQAWRKPLDIARENASLSRSLFKLALLDAGFLDDVQAFVEQTTDQRIKIMWEDSGSFDRLHPDLIRLADELAYTDEQLDAVFGIGVEENQEWVEEEMENV